MGRAAPGDVLMSAASGLFQFVEVPSTLRLCEVGEYYDYHQYLVAARHCEGKIVLHFGSRRKCGTHLLDQAAASITYIEDNLLENGSLTGSPGERQRSPVAGASADVVICFDAIDERLIDEAMRVLRQNGLFIGSIPKRDPDIPPTSGHKPDEPALATLLGSRLPQIRILEQRWLAGSLILNPAEASGPVEWLQLVEGRSVEGRDDILRSSRSMIIASRHPPGVGANSVLAASTGAAEVVFSRKLVAALERALAAERKLRAATEERFAEAELRATQVEARAETIEAERRAAAAIRWMKAAELEIERSRVAELRLAAAARERELQHQVDALQHQFDARERQLQHRFDARERELQHQFDVERESLRSALRSAQTMYEGIVNSTTWRMSTPIRDGLNWLRLRVRGTARRH
jgi:SAM-dependent methyltransferase